MLLTVGYACVGIILFGNLLPEYKDIPAALSSVLMMTLDYFDYDSLGRVNQTVLVPIVSN